jgi:sensor histidine kinase regulating citrate/malate metabolism
MKILGIIVGIIGAMLFVRHLVKVMLDTENSTGIFTHHICRSSAA